MLRPRARVALHSQRVHAGEQPRRGGAPPDDRQGSAGKGESVRPPRRGRAALSDGHERDGVDQRVCVCQRVSTCVNAAKRALAKKVDKK